MRLERETHEEFGLMRLFLVSHGRKLAVGSFLGPDEKESFAAALAAAIGEAKRGPTRNERSDPRKVGTGFPPRRGEGSCAKRARNRVVRRTVQT